MPAGVTPATGVARLIVTDCVAVPPPLVAVQVNVVPAVSAVTLLAAHGADVIADSLSVTVQATETLPVYQPSAPRLPVTTEVMTGGVVSTPCVQTIACVSPVAVFASPTTVPVSLSATPKLSVPVPTVPRSRIVPPGAQ